MSGSGPELQLSVVLSLMTVSNGRPARRLSDSPFFTPPGAPPLLEALIGPKLDCDGPDY